MDETIKKIRKYFIAELLVDGDDWRVFRKITLIDLIVTSFAHYQKDHHDEHLVRIFNYAVKIKLLDVLDPIKLKGTLEETSKSLRESSELVLKKYDDIITEFNLGIHILPSATIQDISAKISYLKVSNDLKLNTISNDVLDETMLIIYSLLKNH